MKILIPGGAGYIGSRLIPELLAEGHHVTVIDPLWFGNHLPRSNNMLVFKGGIEELTNVNVDAVICLSGMSNDPMADTDPLGNFISNGATPAWLAYFCKNTSLTVRKFILASSCSVYGRTESLADVESTKPQTNFPYGISKLQAEAAVRQLDSADFEVVILRKGTVSGHSPRMRADLLLNAMYASKMQHGYITVHDPKIKRPLLGIRDTVRAYKQALNWKSGTYNIASVNTTTGEVADVVGGEQRITGERDPRSYWVKIAPEFEPLDTPASILAELEEHQYDFSDDNLYNMRMFPKITGAAGGSLNFTPPALAALGCATLPRRS